MKKLICIYILILMLLFSVIPTIQYDNKLESGVTVIEHKSIAEWVLDKYNERP